MGDVGVSLGPELTAIGQRLTCKEILRSLLFPSHDIAEQNASMTLLTITGRRYAGLVRRESASRWAVLQSSGVKVSVPAGQVRETVPSEKSAMSEGLLDPLSLDEIADLFAALAVAPPGEVASRPMARCAETAALLLMPLLQYLRPASAPSSLQLGVPRVGLFPPSPPEGERRAIVDYDKAAPLSGGRGPG